MRIARPPFCSAACLLWGSGEFEVVRARSFAPLESAGLQDDGVQTEDDIRDRAELASVRYAFDALEFCLLD